MNTRLRVLIVEDSEDDTKLLVRFMVKQGFEVAHQRVDTAVAMQEALEKGDWDLILADYVMPNFSGLAALELLQAKGIDLPFIIVSGQIGEDIAVEAMKAGASDYILKGHYARLVPAIERELRDAEVRRDRRKTQEERNRLMEQLREVNEQLVQSNVRNMEQAEETEAVIVSLEEVLRDYRAKRTPAN